MKKYISYILAIVSALLLVSSCFQKENPQDEQPVAKMTGIYYVGADVTPGEVMELGAGKTKTVLVRALADSAEVSDISLTILFKADPEAVDAYNSAHGTSYVMSPGSAYEFVTPEAMMPRYGRSSTSAKIKLSGSSLEDGITYILPITIDKITNTDKWQLKDAPHAYIFFKKAYVAPNAGSGTEEDPYNLYTVADLKGMSEQLIEKKMVYFSLQNDIDMAGVEDWIPLNYASPYDYLIDFNGNGHTIDHFTCTFANYPSFFGVLYGNCHDVNFTNAVIESAVGGATGIVGSYCGTSGHPGEAHRVHVQGRVYSPGGNKNGTGGLFGRICEANITACSADVEVESGENYVGCLFGYDSGVSTVSDCWTSGSVTALQMVGGIGGGLIKAGSSVSNCYSTAKVTGSFQLGGILGHANLDKKDGNATNEANNRIERNIAWNEFVHTITTDSDEHYSNGAIVGYTSCLNYLEDCYRKPGFDLTQAPRNAELGYAMTTQGNAGPGSPLVHGTGTFDFAYHGKPAGATATVTSLAKSLGWSSSIWDLSGDLPKLKGKSEGPSEPEGPDPSGQLPDFDEIEF